MMPRLLEKSSGYLFSSCDLREILDQQIAALRSEVDQMEANRLLNTAPADFSKYLVDKYTIEVPRLRRDEWMVNQCETKIDVRHDRNRDIRDRGRPFNIPGQKIEIEIPFDGDPELFYARASTFSPNPPRAKIKEQSLILVYELTHDDKRDIRPEIERTLNEIKGHLAWVQTDVDGFNQDLEQNANSAIENRRQRILTNQGRVASLGIPLKARLEGSQTYATPLVRKKVVPTLPPASSAPYEPEPTLDAENYEHILKVIQNMALVMERSPSAFMRMGEEDLRQHFLVQLNGHFEGNATGETFNVAGKTDILLRANGRNIFIAECKFWRGSKHYEETIEQLLSYAAWRDTKTAILVFTRKTGMTTVLDGVKTASESHPNYKRTIKWKHETGFRYVFHQKRDRNRELTLTVLVFDVPTIE